MGMLPAISASATVSTAVSAPPLAKAEADIALRAVLARFPQFRLAVPPDQLQWRRTRLVRGLTALPLLVQRPGAL